MLEVVRTEYTNKQTSVAYPSNSIFQCKWITVGLIETWFSLIWIDRYKEAGEFELKIETSRENIDMLHEDYYLLYSKSKHAMIIEKIDLITDVENGDYLLVSGRSLESILDRRIVYTKTKFNGKDIARTTNADISTDPSMIRNVIYTLIMDAFGEGGSVIPTNRTVFEFGHFIFPMLFVNQMAKILPTQEELASADNHPFMKMFVTAELYSESLYKVITQLCSEFGIGYRFELTPVTDPSGNVSGIGTQFVVRLYYGLNLTEDLTQNQSGKVVIFSDTFNNLINSEYSLDKRDYKNFVKIDGKYHVKENDQEVETDVSTTVEGKVRNDKNILLSPAGLSRHETYYDGSSISDKIAASITLATSSSFPATITDADKFLGFINYSSVAHLVYDLISAKWHYQEKDTYYTVSELSNNYGISIATTIGGSTVTATVLYSGVQEQTITQDAYKQRLQNEGKGILVEKDFYEDFSAEIAPNITYTYGEDYSLGDIVSFANAYGVYLHCRITEITFSEDENGFNMQPTFEPVSSNLNKIEE